MGVLLAVIGVGATVTVGVAATYLTLRFRYPGRVTFIGESYIGLFDSIVQNLSDLSVLYKNEPVSQNLVLMKGVLVNTGSKDIAETMVEEPLTMQLPGGYKWLTANVVRFSNGVRVETKVVEESRLAFEIGMLRRKEYIKFDALAEIPDTGDSKSHASGSAAQKLENVVGFSHRIADTGEIEKIGGNWASERLSNARRSITWSASIAIFGLVLWLTGIPTESFYLIETPEGETIGVRRTELSETKYKLEGLDAEYSRVVTFDDFYGELDRDFVVEPLYTMMSPTEEIITVKRFDLGETKFLIEGVDSDYSKEVSSSEFFGEIPPSFITDAPYTITTPEGEKITVNVRTLDTARIKLEGIGVDYSEVLTFSEFNERNDVQLEAGPLYQITNAEGKVITVRRTELGEVRIRLEGVGTDYSEELTLNEFNERDNVQRIAGFHYQITTAEGKVITVRSTRLDEGRFRLEGIDTPYEKEVSSSEFFDLDAEFESRRQEGWMTWLLFGGAGLATALSLAHAAYNLVTWRRYKEYLQSVPAG